MSEPCDVDRPVRRHDSKIEMVELIYPRLNKQAWAEAAADMELLCEDGYQFLDNKICSETHWRLRLIRLPKRGASPC